MALIMMRIDEGDGYDDNDLCEMTIIILKIINYVQTFGFWEQNRLWEPPRPVDQSPNLPKSDGKTNTGILREEQWQS